MAGSDPFSHAGGAPMCPIYAGAVIVAFGILIYESLQIIEGWRS